MEVKRADDSKDYPWSSHHHYLRHKKAQKGKRNEARQVAMYLIRELCNKSLKEIAQSFSLGSYGRVGGACSVIERQIKVDRKLRRRIEQIREMASSTSIQKKI